MPRLALLAMLLAPTACQRLACGPGTVEADGQCLGELVECGPGTLRQGDECQPEDVVDCGDGTVRRGDECVAALDQWVHLPFPSGASVTVSQGNHGRFSHNGSAVYAVDFPLPEGSEVAAVRAGRVQRVREDSNTGCGDAACADQANYVVVDHGDGTLASYYHLELDGALVEVGDSVDRGQIIALSGNTGWSTGPHLHLQINDLLYQSVPVRFEDLRDVSDGMAFGRDIPFRSTNTREAPDIPVEWSDCPEDLFLWLGIRLDPGLPCSAAERGESIAFSGTQFGVAQEVVWATSDGSWDYQCGATAGDGSFAATVRFEAARGYEYFIAGAGEGDCTLTNGWPYSPRITILDE